MDLYPLKFHPQFVSKIWGGNRLRDKLGKQVNKLENIGESWELSSVNGNLSVISNGSLANKTIEEAIQQHKEKLVGRKVYQQFGNQFPLLVKFIDANDYLSIQVHPDDDMAKVRHDSYGKTEMWYIVDAEKDAELIVGFNQPMDKQKYQQRMNDGTLRSVLNFEKVNKGDVFHLPAGRIHATGPGILFAEIQQASDITYRIYDWDRTDDNGNARELHTEQAMDAIDFSMVDEYKTAYVSVENQSSEIVKCQYYTTNHLLINDTVRKDYSALDSFIIFMALDGDVELLCGESKESLNKGETILVPAGLSEVAIVPQSAEAKLLEVYID